MSRWVARAARSRRAPKGARHPRAYTAARLPQIQLDRGTGQLNNTLYCVGERESGARFRLIESFAN